MAYDDGGTRNVTGTLTARSSEDVPVRLLEVSPEQHTDYQNRNTPVLSGLGALKEEPPETTLGQRLSVSLGPLRGDLSKSTSKPRVRKPLRSPGTDRRASLGPQVTIERAQWKGECIADTPKLRRRGGPNEGPDGEFAGPEFKMLANIKLYDGTTDPEDHLSRFSSAANSKEWPMLVWCRMFQQNLNGSARGWFKNLSQGSIDGWTELRQQFTTRFSTRRACFKDPTEKPRLSEEAFASTELPKGEVSKTSRRSVGPVSRREDRFYRGGYEADRRRNEGRNTFNNRDGLVPYRAQTSYQAPRDQGFHHPRFNLSSLTKLSKKILASKPQLNLQPPRPMQLPPKKKNQDKYCDYHGEKRHYTNNCFQLRRQLEMALASGKLNHLIKDVRQRGRGNAKGRDAGKEKVTNMIRRGLGRATHHRSGHGRILGSQGFARGVVKPLWNNKLEVVFRDGGLFRTVMINFTVVRPPSPYNAIFGKTGLRSIRAVSSTIHSMVREEENGGNIGQSEYQPRERSPEKSGFYGTNISQPSVPRSTGNNRGKPVGAMQESAQNIAKEKNGCFRNPLHKKEGLWYPTEPRLKNARDTYQRVVDTAFQSQIGRNLEAYVDDMVIKINDEKVLIEDITETFDNLRRIIMKLNPKKCSFGVEEVKFLGYMVTSEGIRVNPKKTKAIADMQSPRTLKETQSLSGKLAALKRFLSRAFATNHPSKGGNAIRIRSSGNGGRLIHPWSSVLAYIIDKGILLGLIKRYLLKRARFNIFSQSIAYAITGYKAKRLRRYFKAHPIKVITDQPLKQILNKARALGKLAKYSVELGAYNITYEPRSAMKGLNFASTNNDAEYEALLAGLR
nr:reverse transcriptase domain-containing protein [Tanacetum cinerariifolium]